MKLQLFITTLFIVLFSFVKLSSQGFSNLSNIWYFGNNAGINFNTLGISALEDGVLDTQEGVACISDKDGNLLFYTDGITVWDKTHQAMPSGDNVLKGHFSSTQSGLIVPDFYNDGIYYLFTVDELAGNNGLQYSKVDMNLVGNGTAANKLGDVIISERNIELLSPVTEKLTAVLMPNQLAYWVITHGWNNNSFFAFKVDCNGVSENAVISDIGAFHQGGNDNVNAVGYLKSSLDGTKLACVNRFNGSIDLFDFDKRTGQVSNYVEINMNSELLYGIEFSSSGQYLFIGGRSDIYRYNILDQSMQTISIDDPSLLNSNNVIRALQIGPDGNIHVSIRDLTFLSTINTPETNPQLIINSIPLNSSGNSRNCRFGLPNIFYLDKVTRDTVTEMICPESTLEVEGVFYEAGTVNDIVTSNASGCDSIYVLDLKEHNVYTEVLELELCENQFFEFNGVDIAAGESELFTFQDANGCDSIILVETAQSDLFFGEAFYEICDEEEIEFRGTIYSNSIDTLLQFTNLSECDSIINLLIDVLAPMNLESNIEDSCPDEGTGQININNITNGEPPFFYSLNNGPFAGIEILDNLETGDYSLTIRDNNNCETTEDLTIESIQNIEVVFEEAIFECQSDSVSIEIETPFHDIDSLNIEWISTSLFNAANNMLFAYEPGIFELYISNQCETKNVNIEIGIIEDTIPKTFYSPNVFASGLLAPNNGFKIFFPPETEVISFEIMIYDRWGSKVFTSLDPDFCWDAYYHNDFLEAGVYVWKLDATIQSCKQESVISRTGNVTFLK